VFKNGNSSELKRISQEGAHFDCFSMFPWKLTTKLCIIRKAAPLAEGNSNESQSPVLRAGADTLIDNSIQAVNTVSAMGALFPPLKATADMLNVVLNNVRVRMSSFV
jgi:hypothetical protein